MIGKLLGDVSIHAAAGHFTSNQVRKQRERWEWLGAKVPFDTRVERIPGQREYVLLSSKKDPEVIGRISSRSLIGSFHHLVGAFRASEHLEGYLVELSGLLEYECRRRGLLYILKATFKKEVQEDGHNGEFG